MLSAALLMMMELRRFTAERKRERSMMISGVPCTVSVFVKAGQLVLPPKEYACESGDCNPVFTGFINLRIMRGTEVPLLSRGWEDLQMQMTHCVRNLLADFLRKKEYHFLVTIGQHNRYDVVFPK